MSASPLTKDRASSKRKIRMDRRPLAAATKVFRNGLAACVAGYYQPASGVPGEVIVGRFYGAADNSAGAAGAVSANVEFFRERDVVLLDNDGTSPIVVANRETFCSVLDDHTATQFSAAAGEAVVVYDVTSEGVWVEFPYPASPNESGVPVIQSGTTTLVAGAKTVSGVALTASSRIFVMMKDPGAGAITGFASFDTPAASRNVGAGTFLINAIDDTKAVIATAVCTVDYLVIG